MKQGFQNLHTHTTYCDGDSSVEDMIIAAIQKGGGSIGFSEHSYVYFDPEYSINPIDIPSYIGDVKRLKEKYRNEIDVFLGLEVDHFTEEVPDGLDYVIGATHHIQIDGEHLTVDATPERLKSAVQEFFGGDFYSLIETFYETAANVAKKTNADIIAHFDIIKKHNTGGRLFDESHPRYIDAAISAIEKLLKDNKLFELNTGAMYRKGLSEQYPSTFLLKELKKRGGEILFSSDSHDTESLYYKFDEMSEIARSCGFTHIKRLTADGFVDVKI